MYDASRRLVRLRMRDEHGRWTRITAEEIHRALASAGHPCSLSAVRKVLSGELVSRPLLRLVSGTVRALRERRREAVPEWL